MPDYCKVGYSPVELVVIAIVYHIQMKVGLS